jgi:hypothetical protein
MLTILLGERLEFRTRAKKIRTVASTEVRSENDRVAKVKSLFRRFVPRKFVTNVEPT